MLRNRFPEAAMTRRSEARNAVKRGRRPAGHRLTCLFLAFTCASVLKAGPLEDAARFETAGDTAAAVRTYRTWLASNQTDPRFRDTLLHTAGLAPDVSDAIGLLAGLVPELADGVAKHTVLTTLAAFEELDGRYADAQRHYEEASYTVPGKKDYASLLESAGLLFSLGDTTGAEVRARAIMLTCDDQELLSGTAALYARIFSVSGRFRDGIETLEKIRKTVPGKETPALLFLLVQLYHIEGSEAEADAVRTELSTRFPESPEALILSGSHIAGASAPALFPEPSLLLEFPGLPAESRSASAGKQPAGADPAGPGPDAAGVTGTGAAIPDSTERTTVRTASAAPDGTAQGGSGGREIILIQTGSYQKHENAEEMLARLQAAGFKPEIRTTEIGGKTYHRVFVPASSSIEEARHMQQRLKDRGVEGFLVFVPE